VNGSDTEIRFQRARMPGAKPAFGILLKEQLPHILSMKKR